MGKLIGLIYFYLVSIIGLILLIIGLYNSVSFVVNTTQYDAYPLRYAGNESCDYILSQSAPAKPTEPNSVPSISPEDQKKQLDECKARVERERKQTQVEDMKNSIYFTLIGILLLAIHLPIALKKSSEEKHK